ncbi:MAG: SGNH/GDSL hydrolase family protein [Pirellulaceae bacterium]
MLYRHHVLNGFFCLWMLVRCATGQVNQPYLPMVSSAAQHLADATVVTERTVDADAKLAWYDAAQMQREGQAWTDTESPFDRLPERAKEVVRPPVWSLSKNSAGLCLRWETDASSIHVRWELTSPNLDMPHMPATGVSGVDLYVRTESGWQWLANGRPTAQTNEVRLVGSLPAGRHEFLLYLPLYNGVKSLQIGLPPNATLWQKTFTAERKPIVFWGTSITQGGCASRPGMVHTAILGRRLHRPVINLGFSGNGKMEPEVAGLLAEIDAGLFVIDCLPNLTHAEVTERTEPLVRTLRDKHPDTPILLVEDRSYSDSYLIESKRQRNQQSRHALRMAFDSLQKDGVRHVHYLSGEWLLGIDAEGTVDSSHPTDLGFWRQANAMEPILRQLVGDTADDVRWLKGNLHTHSLWSDGNDFPEMIADWYRQHGYQFLALSDHNVLSQGTRWMKLTDIENRNGQTALPKYVARFGQDWVQTRTNQDGVVEVRLKPLGEVRSLVEVAGEFLMIPSEEITDKGAHINATNIGEVIEPQGGETVREMIQNNLRAIDAQAKALGRLIIPHLNHPNLGDKGISAEELAALVEDEFFEVFNGVEGDGDLGSPRRHSLETLWDITSTLRLSQFRARPLYALATDDSHHYHGGQKASPGRGWIMLRANRLTPETVLRSMQRGDFYASSGVELERIEFDPETNVLQIQIKPDADATFVTEFIGTPINFDKTTSVRTEPETGEPIPGTLDYSADVGKVFARVEGLHAAYQLTGDELYVRATITSNKPPQNPTNESSFKKAWTQPVGWQHHVK